MNVKFGRYLRDVLTGLCVVFRCKLRISRESRFRSRGNLAQPFSNMELEEEESVDGLDSSIGAAVVVRRTIDPG